MLFEREDSIDAVGKKVMLLAAFRQTECLEEQGEEKTSLKPQDAKEWADRMKENGYAYKTVTIISVL